MLTGFDHIVLCVADIERTISFYKSALGMQPYEEGPNKWSLRFGSHKISLQDTKMVPDMAKGTVPGSGNFCILTKEPVQNLAERLRILGIDILEGPAEREGATGKISSIYFYDPDDNLVEISNPLTA